MPKVSKCDNSQQIGLYKTLEHQPIQICGPSIMIIGGNSGVPEPILPA